MNDHAQEAYRDAKQMERYSLLTELTTLCWNCNEQYPLDAPACPTCSSTNPNVNHEKAYKELLECCHGSKA